MRSIHHKVDGNLRVDTDLEIFGMIDGDLTVAPGGTVHLLGMCTGDVIIEIQGHLRLDGTVIGNVTNRGGEIVVLGTIRGILREEAGVTTVAPGAVVGGTRS